MTANTLRHLATGILLLVATVDAKAAERKMTNRPTLTVQLLNLADVEDTELEKAIAEASWIFGKAGVNLHWVHCRRESSDLTKAACQDLDDPLVFSLGVVTKSQDFLRDSGFGFALVNSGGRNHAGVLYPKIVALTQAHPLLASLNQVLAYAMVHELTHLILGSTAHRATGIMRAGFRPEDLKAVGQRHLRFRGDEVEALHRKLSERKRQYELRVAKAR